MIRQHALEQLGDLILEDCDGYTEFISPLTSTLTLSGTKYEFKTQNPETLATYQITLEVEEVEPNEKPEPFPDTSEMTLDEIKAELKEQGVDVDAHLVKLREIVLQAVNEHESAQNSESTHPIHPAYKTLPYIHPPFQNTTPT
jgi:hypothetical protein